MSKISCAERIKQGLNIRELKPADLCRMTDINKSTMSQYLSGVYDPSQVKLELISRALNVSEAWLMGYDVSIERRARNKADTEAETLHQMITAAKLHKGRVLILGNGNEAETILMTEDELMMFKAMLKAYRKQRKHI